MNVFINDHKFRQSQRFYPITYQDQNLPTESDTMKKNAKKFNASNIHNFRLQLYIHATQFKI